MEVEGVGIFHKGSGFWEAEPDSLQGALLSIESEAINTEQAARAKTICANWQSILGQCKQFIESNRHDYQLHAKSFTNPNVFIEAEDRWSVYFDTEVSIEAVVGVEFSGHLPSQLIIGD